jgi:hypothetical protein
MKQYCKNRMNYKVKLNFSQRIIRNQIRFKSINFLKTNLTMIIS